MNSRELCQYYANLLIKQYKGKPKAYATIEATAASLNMLQTTVDDVSLSGTPASGTIRFGYQGHDTGDLPFNASEADIQTAFRSIPGLSEVVVTGRFVTGSIRVSFDGVAAPAGDLVLLSSTLETGTSDEVIVTISEADKTLPLAVMDGYNLTGPNTAVGKQLDVLAKYVGVARTGVGPLGPQTLGDADLLTLIRIAIDRNKLTSRFGDIADFFYKWFPSQVVVADNFDMTMAVSVYAGLEQTPLWQLFLAFGLMPRPQGVGIYLSSSEVPLEMYFGLRTYPSYDPAANPFNTYDEFNEDNIFMTYDDT